MSAGARNAAAAGPAALVGDDQCDSCARALALAAAGRGVGLPGCAVSGAGA